MVLADVAKRFGISETEASHYARELGISVESMYPRWRERLEDYIKSCLRGDAAIPTRAGSRADFIWRFSKKKMVERGFAGSQRLRRAAEAVALSSAAHVERVGARLVITFDACTVVLEALVEGALIVTAFAHEPFTTARFLEVAGRISERVTLETRLGDLA